MSTLFLRTLRDDPSDASARVTPKSACTAGSITDTTYMPAEPTVINNSVASRRHQAWRVSGWGKELIARLSGGGADATTAIAPH